MQLMAAFGPLFYCVEITVEIYGDRYITSEGIVMILIIIELDFKFMVFGGFSGFMGFSVI